MRHLSMLLLALGLFYGAARADKKSAQQALTVELLSAEETRWTSTRDDPGSSGTTTSTNCSTTDSTVDCTSRTTGATPASSTPIYHTYVSIVVRMPDGNEVKMQCHSPVDLVFLHPIYVGCFKPEVGSYQAKIDKHEVHLLYHVQGRPEYNKDGTIKKAGTVKEEWIKFSFE
jgi:hypothetical protein